MAMLISLKRIKEKSKKKCRESLFMIPALFTFLNAIFGFLSILKSFDGEYRMAAFYIMIAAFFDGLDGRLARATGTSSYFGMELDSLCDAISFCLAPTILLYCWIPLETLFCKLVLALYLCAGLARLAKFNIMAQKNYAYFIGLPTTIAAFFISTLVVYHNWISTHWTNIILQKNMLLLIIAFIAFLMVSTIKFPAFKKYKLQITKNYLKLTALSILFLWLIVHKLPILFLIMSGYILLGLITYLLDLLKIRHNFKF